ncbi:MAG: hypothetical protein IKH71_10905 [Oscillospiraceae bacterium]|nr:hypothetical protein [Oscillospiraceae bacterium]
MNHLIERTDPFSSEMDKEAKPDNQTLENKLWIKFGSAGATVSNTYDAITKRLLDLLDDMVIVEFVNHIFSKNYSKDSKVTRLATESTDQVLKTQRCDYYIAIENDFFHIEIQSVSDSKMSLRIFEYVIHEAITHGKEKTDGERTKLIIPESVVFYLRKGKKSLPDKPVILHQNDKQDFVFGPKSVFIADYSYDQMLEKYMYPLLPFYPMRYEKVLLNAHSESDEKSILDDLAESTAELKNAVEKVIITHTDYSFIKYWTLKVFEIILEKARKRGTLVNEKEAYRIMQMISDEMITGYDIYKDLELSEAKGRAEGREEGITETALNMLKLNAPEDFISQCTGFTLEEIENLRKQL